MWAPHFVAGITFPRRRAEPFVPKPGLGLCNAPRASTSCEPSTAVRRLRSTVYHRIYTRVISALARAILTVTATGILALNSAYPILAA